MHALVLYISLSLLLTNSFALSQSSETAVNNFKLINSTDIQYKQEGILLQSEPTEAQLDFLASQFEAINGPEDKGLDPRSLLKTSTTIKEVAYTFGLHGYHVAQMTITDASKERYSIDTEAVHKPFILPQFRLEMLGFELKQDPFSFSFSDVTDHDNWLLSTEGGNFVFLDQYMQLDFKLPSQRVFGLGERIREFGLGEGLWTMWAFGQANMYDTGNGMNHLNGVHPFALIQTKVPGDFIGVFFRNSNAQYPMLKFHEDGTSTLSYVTIGGQFEAYFFLHKSAKEIIQLYHKVIGKPYLPPFWSVGWAQSSWKYQTQSHFEDMLDSYDDNFFPLDYIFFDIPYMNKYADFSVDTEAFPDLEGFREKLDERERKLVVILDGGISADDLKNKYYLQAQEDKILIQSSKNPELYEGALVSKVWPDHTVFIDWFHQSVSNTWHQGLQDLKAQIHYDGLWLDMNEVATFCNGECPVYPEEESLRIERRLSESETEDVDKLTHYLQAFSLSLDAVHPSNNLTEYDLHSLYGHMMSKRTNKFLTKDEDKRPFILTRSTFAGTGQYASHWFGDNYGSWKHMRLSIASLLNSNMYGIPHAGADVCGLFGKEVDDELCLRWIQLSTFYPMARSHQNHSYFGQENEGHEPYNLEEPFKSQARASLFDRYQYLRFMYTGLFEAHHNGGGVIEPLFFHFPQDDVAIEVSDVTFMVGDAIKASPVLESLSEGETFTSYFPKGKWLDMYDFSVLDLSETEGKWVDLEPKDVLIKHLREGHMIPFQDNSLQDSYTTRDLLQKPVDLVFMRDEYGYAEGRIFLDSGEDSLQDINRGKYMYFVMALSQNSINFFRDSGFKEEVESKFGKIVIADAEDLSTVDFACYMDIDYKPHELTTTYDVDKKKLEIYASEDIGFEDFRVIYYGSSSKDLNLCHSSAYEYSLKGSSLDLSNSEVTFKLESSGVNAGKLADLEVTMNLLEGHIIHMSWQYDSSISHNERIPFSNPKDVVNPSISYFGSLLDFVSVQESPFMLTIFGQEGEQVLDLEGLLLSSWLNEMQLKIYQDANNFQEIVGIGEKVSRTLGKKSGVYSLFNKEAPSPIEDGKPPGNNMYGSHPFFMFSTSPKTWTGVFSNVVQAQDWYIDSSPSTSSTSIHSIAIGGIGDLYVITGQSPSAVASSYQNFIVGRPTLPPFYALGWNQCRWGYRDTAKLREVVQGYEENGIPLDNMWVDIDYMDSYRDFTVDPVNFAGLGDFVEELHEKGMHFVPILDAGVAVRTWGDYQSYLDGLEKGVYVDSGVDGQGPFIGEVWPNDAVFPDWFNQDANKWWQEQMANLRSIVHFDGMWLDMDEISNFCDGPCLSSQMPSSSLLKSLRYAPTDRNLNTRAMSVDALHSNGFHEIDTHNLFGTLETKATHDYFQSVGERSFIIGRSQFAGMGKFGGNWLGDNYSFDYYMQAAFPMIMQMNMFGITLTGADICGFAGFAEPKQCLRWTMIGAFYPFARNHNFLYATPQEPYAFKHIPYTLRNSYMDMMKQGIQNRYIVLKYYYTQFFLNSIYGEGQFIHPQYYEFPSDPNAYSDYDGQVMLGPSLRLSAQTSTRVDTRTFYFPKGSWCDILAPTTACLNLAEGTYLEMSTQAHEIYVHLLEGQVAPLQRAKEFEVVNTGDLAYLPIDLHVHLKLEDTFRSASGVYINDDGLSIVQEGSFNHYRLKSFVEDDGAVVMEISMWENAKDYLSQDGCSAIDQSDMLGQLIFYNAAYLGLAEQDYEVEVETTNSEIISTGEAYLDNETDRVIVEWNEDLCLSTIQKITLRPTQ